MATKIRDKALVSNDRGGSHVLQITAMYCQHMPLHGGN